MTEKYARFTESRDYKGGASGPGPDGEGFDAPAEPVDVEQACMTQPIPENNIGHRLLVKQGWQVGKGLGKQSQGRVDPIPIIIKEEVMGFGRLQMELEHAEETTERRRLMECEKENTEELQQKYKDNQERERAKEVSLESLKSSFYCDLCEKQYFKHTDFDNHVNSYDHAHKQRLQELKRLEFSRQVGCKRDKEYKKLEREMRRISDYADSRAQPGAQHKGMLECNIDPEDMQQIPMPVSPPAPVVTMMIPNPADIPTPPSDGGSPNQNRGLVSFSLSKKTSFAKVAKNPSVFSATFQGKGVVSVDGTVEPENPSKDSPEKEKDGAAKEIAKNSDSAEVQDAADKDEECYPLEAPAKCAAKLQFSFLKFVKSDLKGVDGEDTGGSGDHIKLPSKNCEENHSKVSSTSANTNKNSPLGSSGDANISTDAQNPLGNPEDKILEPGTQLPDDKSQRLLTFVQVLSQDDQVELQWPGEMIQYTKTEPVIMYSCNPLYFDLTQLIGKPKTPVREDTSDTTKVPPSSETCDKGNLGDTQVSADKAVTETTVEAKVEQGKSEEAAAVEGEDTAAPKEEKKKSHKKKKHKKHKHADSEKENVDADDEQEKGTEKSEKRKQKKHKKRKKHKKSSSKSKDNDAAENSDGEGHVDSKSTKRKHKKKRKKSKHQKKSDGSESSSEGEHENKPAKDNGEENSQTVKDSKLPVAESTPSKSKSRKKKKVPTATLR